MWKAAVVEDEREAAERIAEYLGRFGAENGETFDVSYYGDAEAFLAGYDPECDIVFMDIQLPDMSGMDAARALRAVDSEVTLVFVTSMVQYAVSGYEVSALDFIVKPVSYPNFAMKMKRVLRERRLRAAFGRAVSFRRRGSAACFRKFGKIHRGGRSSPHIPHVRRRRGRVRSARRDGKDACRQRFFALQ